jgi:integrase
MAKLEHHAAMPYKQVPAFMTYLRGKNDISSRCLEFLILTAARTGESRGALWTEFDLANKLWVIPAQRMKAKAEHRVPLSDRAIEILQEMAELKTCDYVFAGKKPNTPISDMAMLMLMRRNEQNYVTHGFRSSFRDWAAETTIHDNHVVEMALAHRISNQVEAAYRRGDLLWVIPP